MHAFTAMHLSRISTTGGYWHTLTGQFAASKQELSNRYYPERSMNIRELLQYILLNCDGFIGDSYDHKILHPDRMEILVNINFSLVGVLSVRIYEC